MQAKALRGVHVLWMLIAFFALIIAVDAFFIVRAVATFPGEQVKNSYVLGLDYNREVERRERQREIGWRAEAGISSGGGQSLVVRLKSSANEPVSGLNLSARVFSAAAGGSDETIALQERGAGEYAASVSFPARARVEIAVSALRPGEAAPVFEATKTLVVP
jgi:nitrogen fixation protein FixH